jgi:hypothetical protein
MGAVLVTVPAGNATTTDIASNAGRFDCEKTASPFFVICAWLHSAVDPNVPSKHATRVTSAGAVTRTFTSPIDCSHSLPITFQNSSSWLSNPFIAPSTR